MVYEKSGCPSTECSWVSDGGGGDGPGGDDFGRCLKKGENQRCTDIFEPSECAKQKSDCKWFDAIERCTASDFNPSCTCYNGFGPELCPVTDGKCELQDGVCSEPGATITCNLIPFAGSCDNSGHCTWNQADYRCTDCKDGICPKKMPCATYASQETCPESHCEFEMANFEDGDDGICADKSCGEMDPAMCQAASECEWYSTSPPEGICFAKGLDVPCNQYWEESDCDSATSKCHWDQENYHCLETGELEPCTSFQGADCPSPRCVVAKASDQNYNECQIDTSKFPSKPDKLNGKGDGTGNEDKEKCSASQFSDIRSKLEQAQDECGVIHRRGRRAEDLQVECLSYFLSQAPSPTTIADACPCIWRYADAVDRFSSGWMKVAC